MAAAGPSPQEVLTPEDILELWPILDPEEQMEGFRQLDRRAAESFFLSRATVGQATLILGLPEGERRGWLRLLKPDDAADVLQRVPAERRSELLALLDEPTRHEVHALLAYAEDEAGGLMNPRYARLRPDMRAGWLTVLFIGEMLTATAMARYEEEIARAVVLALFVPLIISSGGNSGSQASTLIVRAMALGEVRLSHVLRVLRPEVASGLVLGGILASIGFARILLWQGLFSTYGEHAALIAITVGLSLIGVVTWGTISGSMLPFLLRRLRLDPASASAPFVATLVDVSGLVTYFSVAQLVLHGTLL